MHTKWNVFGCLLGILALAAPGFSQNSIEAPVVTVAASDPSASETGPEPGRFTISRRGNTNTGIVVVFQVGGTARNGEDYRPVTNSVFLPPGMVATHVPILPIDDSLTESNEAVVLRLQPSPMLGIIEQYRIGWPSNAVVNIQDNDRTPETNRPPQQVVNISTVDPAGTEIPVVPDGLGMPQRIDPAAFRVWRTGDTNITLNVYYHVSGSASNGVDYERLSGTLEIPAGQMAAHLEVLPIDDFIPEKPESVIVTLEPPVCIAIFPPPPECYVLGSSYRANAVIQDNDAQPTNELPVVTISAPDPEAVEGADNSAAFQIRRSGRTADPLLVHYLIGGTAQNGIDYEQVANRVEIPAGAFEASVKIGAIDDSLAEGRESVNLQLIHPPPTTNILPPPSYIIGSPGAAFAAIVDNDGVSSNAPPMVQIVTPGEGSVFRVPANITIAANARDFDGTVVSVEFFEGDRSLGIKSNAPVLNPIGPFVLVWSNVPPGRYSLTAKATDDDGAIGVSRPVRISVAETNLPPPPTNIPLVSIAAVDAFASEGLICYTNRSWWNYVAGTSSDPEGTIRTNGGCFTNVAVFRVGRQGTTNADLRVYYLISGTASNGVDYAPLARTAVIPAGRRVAEIVVKPIEDTLSEGPESVVLTLILPPLPLAEGDTPYHTGSANRAAAFINDNDLPRPPSLCFPDRLMHVCLPGENGGCYRIEASDDLVHWESVGTVCVVDGAVHFVDPEAPSRRLRFYRALPERLEALE